MYHVLVVIICNCSIACYVIQYKRHYSRMVIAYKQFVRRSSNTIDMNFRANILRLILCRKWEPQEYKYRLLPFKNTLRYSIAVCAICLGHHSIKHLRHALQIAKRDKAAISPIVTVVTISVFAKLKLQSITRGKIYCKTIPYCLSIRSNPTLC